MDLYSSVADTPSKPKPGIDKFFLTLSVLLVVILIGVSIYSIAFISNRILNAFDTSGGPENAVEFNLEGYENLDL